MAEFKTPVKHNKPIQCDEQIIIPPSPFLNRLGYGTGVSVMQLVRSPRAGQIRSPWALKMINKRVKPCNVYSERLKAEADLLQKMSHPNIVGFRAFSGDKILYLGMEACDLSLGDMIEKKVDEQSEAFTPSQMLKMTSDIASALDYLHTTMRMLHGDMKSYNILVNGDFVICKLCDFGVTLPLDEKGVVDKKKDKNAVYFGTEAWSAPEVIHGDDISHKTDIWPLGLTLWEMMALMPPHTQDDDDIHDDYIGNTSEEDDDDFIRNHGIDFASSAIYQRYLEEKRENRKDDTMNSDNHFSDKYGTRPPIPLNISEKAYADPLALFYCCTETTAASRPSARHLAVAAQDMLDQATKAVNQQVQ